MMLTPLLWPPWPPPWPPRWPWPAGVGGDCFLGEGEPLCFVMETCKHGCWMIWRLWQLAGHDMPHILLVIGQEHTVLEIFCFEIVYKYTFLGSLQQVWL